MAQIDIFYYDSPGSDLSQVFDDDQENQSEQYNFDYKLAFAKEGHNL